MELWENPLPGDIVAIEKEGAHSSGHVGIVYADGYTISSSSADNNQGRIVLNDWGFRENQRDKAVFRRKG